MLHRIVPMILAAVVCCAQAEAQVPTMPAPNAAALWRDAQRLNREGLLAQATVAARAAMETGRSSGGVLDFTDLDAGTLLVELLHKQARYDEARQAAQEQIAYWDRQAAADGRSNRRDSRIISMLGRAIEASMQAGEKTQVTRLQEKLFAVASPDAGLWSLSPQEPRLRYTLADFSMPLMLGQWKVTKFEPAARRDDNTYVLYTQELKGGRLSAEIALSYDEAQRRVSAAQRQESLKSYQQRHQATPLELAMPDLALDGLTSFKRGEPSVCEGKECINVHWLMQRGDWRMDIDVTFAPGDEALAAEQMHQLFAALKWNSAPPLFRQRPMAEQVRDIESTAAIPGGMNKAAHLAQQALPDAYFAPEIARLQTYIGLAQYRQGNLDAARHSLDVAMPAWESAYADEILRHNAFDYAADIAYRQGRNQEAVALSRKLIAWMETGATLGWAVPNDGNTLVNRIKGVHLPLRVGDYRVRMESQGRFFYENLQTGAQLGLILGMSQSSDQELELLLRDFMSKTLSLQAAGVRKTGFSPKSDASGGAQPSGHQWEFDVTPLPDEQQVSSEDLFSGITHKTPTKMVFWIVDRKEQRSMLRAPVTDSGRSRLEAEQIAKALSW
ncbi:hypothetical protein ACIOZM_19400 [Pseudomonas sp. NPDC087346]|uniref:hypothetical protein n=1 Tax=Pseudomonas sp. NPDC087346 TaxID=3364438 RepID=UPI003826FB3A